MARPANGPSGEERRRQIISVAARMFAAKGYTDATTKDIAAEAGVTHAAIYHYFRDKRALFEAVLAAYSPLSAVAAVVQTAGADEEPRAVLTRLTLAMIERLETSGELPVFQLLMSEALRDPDATADEHSRNRRDGAHHSSPRDCHLGAEASAPTQRRSKAPRRSSLNLLQRAAKRLMRSPDFSLPR